MISYFLRFEKFSKPNLIFINNSYGSYNSCNYTIKHITSVYTNIDKKVTENRMFIMTWFSLICLK